MRKPSKPKLPNKIFAPVWRLPFVLDKYRTRGKGSKLVGEPPGWLQAAIESGLVEMVPTPPGGTPVGYFEQVDKNFVVPKITEEEIEAMVLAGLLNDLEKK